MDDGARREESDGEEDMPDYRVLAALAQRHKPGAEAPVIPKRGEKDFEPTGFGGQSKALALSRDALFSAIRTERAHSSKTLSTATWDPVLRRAFVFTQRGQSCTHIGVTERRHVDGRAVTHLELLPEETVYLMERGALDCRLTRTPGEVPSEAAHAACIPLSVAQAYAQVLGTDGATLARYQIYAYLKRLGYIVQRAEVVERVRARAAPPAPRRRPAAWLAALGAAVLRVLAACVRRMQYVARLVTSRVRRTRGLLRIAPGDTYERVFDALRIVPTAARVPPAGGADVLAPFFYAWRPATHYRRTQPPPPEFRICVLETDAHPMLHLHDFEVLFSHVPLPTDADAGEPDADEAQLEAIREQNRRAYGKQRKVPRPKPSARPAHVASIVGRFLWLVRVLGAVLRRLARGCGLARMPPRPAGNVYLPLKAGRRSVVVAIVDQGTMSLLRFGEAEFTRWRLAGSAPT
ncbi:tRNA-splicing endonuclease subunit sen54 [Malassezia obtusa]|uniref:tRNA-splicing endonuclease subunit sen54 n=1 Tax=Malassezia obtusa TaxID=76774 RepID=A0AAF0DXE1_9BASI|nr:tRNA-splicing endonuclease subunit sen54 [Malassezia obtusa]